MQIEINIEDYMDDDNIAEIIHDVITQKVRAEVDDYLNGKLDRIVLRAVSEQIVSMMGEETETVYVDRANELMREAAAELREWHIFSHRRATEIIGSVIDANEDTLRSQVTDLLAGSDPYVKEELGFALVTAIAKRITDTALRPLD